jgi:hypothetical protein
MPFQVLRGNRADGTGRLTRAFSRWFADRAGRVFGARSHCTHRLSGLCVGGTSATNYSIAVPGRGHMMNAYPGLATGTGSPRPSWVPVRIRASANARLDGLERVRAVPFLPLTIASTAPIVGMVTEYRTTVRGRRAGATGVTPNARAERRWHRPGRAGGGLARSYQRSAPAQPSSNASAVTTAQAASS